MANKFGLGKGLGALIPERLPVRGAPGDRVEVAMGFGPGETAPVGGSTDVAASSDGRATSGMGTLPEGEEILIIPLARIRPNPDQPRKDFPEESIEELASSIKRHGLIQPILVEIDSRAESGIRAPGSDPSEEGSFYRIIAGERRYRAALRADLAEIPAIVRRFTPEKRLEISLIENIQRENLNPVEEAEAYRSLMELSGATQDEIAEAVGKSRSAIANAVRLLKLSPRMLESLRSGVITAGHARALLALPDAPVRDKLFARISEESLSVRQAEDAAQAVLAAAPGSARKAKAARKAAEAANRDPDLVAVEQKLIQSLGTKVSIKGSAKKGIVEVEYYSLEDLDRIIEVLGR